jgi:NADH-quinone oxidoreductase subunit C/D
VWPAADWFEREAFDLYGFDFPGHPNLRRILCHDAFVGHALRKDYAPGQRWFATEEDMKMPDWSEETETRAGHFETLSLSIGPSHPATHGIIHLIARSDGERITRAETQIGYLHRCFEKMAETHTWNGVIPYADRLNYVSAMINGVGYVRTVERMLGVAIPDRGVLARRSSRSSPASWITASTSARTSWTSGRSRTSGISTSPERRFTGSWRRAAARA